MDINIFSNITWIIYTIYCFGLFPQVYLNYKLGTARAMSDYMLIGYLAGYIAQFFYVMNGNFPLAYKVMIPVNLIIVSVLVSQRFYFHRNSIPTNIKTIYFSIISFAFFYAPLFFIYKPSLSLYLGWTSTIIFCLYPIPQIMATYRRKSIKGLSIAFVSMMVFALSLEFVSAIRLNLPMPTILNGARGVFVYGVIFSQTYIYGK